MFADACTSEANCDIIVSYIIQERLATLRWLMTSPAIARPNCLNMSARQRPSLSASPPWVSSTTPVRKGWIRRPVLNFWWDLGFFYTGRISSEWRICFLSAGESGSADTVRDPRGFAVKFYTEEGNWDLTGNNTPIFFIRDALLVSVRGKNVTVCAILTRAACQTHHAWLLCTVQFPSFIHTQKRNPQTHMKDPDMVWDFWSLRPESLHQVPAAHPEPAAERADKRAGETCWCQWKWPLAYVINVNDFI